ncbi:MAG: hypothetical protein QM303_04250 [Bacillota bacterium]|jgi:hypothetical protein|nr:hypothetical protein [Bacillota bacterium]
MSSLRNELKEKYIFELKAITPSPFPQLTAPCLLHMSKEQNVIFSWWAVTEPVVWESEPFRHDFDQFVFFAGSGTTMDRLGGVVEFHLGDEKGNMEKFIITKPAIIYVKAGLYHCPLIFKEVYDPNKPILFNDISLAGVYRKYKPGSDQPLGINNEPIEKTW